MFILQHFTTYLRIVKHDVHSTAPHWTQSEDRLQNLQVCHLESLAFASGLRCSQQLTAIRIRRIKCDEHKPYCLKQAQFLHRLLDHLSMVPDLVQPDAQAQVVSVTATTVPKRIFKSRSGATAEHIVCKRTYLCLLDWTRARATWSSTTTSHNPCCPTASTMISGLEQRCKWLCQSLQFVTL
jgi:hypothetical protein